MMEIKNLSKTSVTSTFLKMKCLTKDSDNLIKTNKIKQINKYMNSDDKTLRNNQKMQKTQH